MSKIRDIFAAGEFVWDLAQSAVPPNSKTPILPINQSALSSTSAKKRERIHYVQNLYF